MEVGGNGTSGEGQGGGDKKDSGERKPVRRRISRNELQRILTLLAWIQMLVEVVDDPQLLELVAEVQLGANLLYYLTARRNGPQN